MREIKEPYRVLIVDDEEMFTDLLHNYLEEIYPKKFTIKVTNNPAAALEILKSDNINILITDLLMPEVPGEVLLQFCRDSNKGTQIIIVSGAESLNLAINGFSLGASSFIGKPFSKQEIEKAVGLVLKQLDHWRILINSIVVKRTSTQKK